MDAQAAVVDRLLRSLSKVRAFGRPDHTGIDELCTLLAGKLQGISACDIVEPESNVLCPALDALACSMDDAVLCNLYVNLLAKAMIREQREYALPAFVEIIRQLSARDASNISLFLREGSYPIVEYKLSYRLSGFAPAYQHIFIANQAYADLEHQSLSILSLERLGLLKTDYAARLFAAPYGAFLETGLYRSIKHLYEDLAKTASLTDKPIECIEGTVSVTPFGRYFLYACVRDSAREAWAVRAQTTGTSS